MTSKQHNYKVSVVMPAYNAEKFVKAAVDSVLSQTYENLELLIIDDCSTDNTYNLLENIAMTDARIKLFKNEQNLGVANTRNRGFELADGEYVALIDSDDIWRREKLEKQISVIEGQKADLVYCSYAFINEKGQSMNKEYIVPEKTDFESLLRENVIGCSTVLISKNIYRKYRFLTDYYHEDYVLWLSILKEKYIFIGLKDVLVNYRVMENSRSGNKVKSAIKRWNIYRDFLKIPTLKAGIIWIKYVINGTIKYS